MFTGLIRATGPVRRIEPTGSGLRLHVDIAHLPGSPEIGASIAVNGVCLTVTALHDSVAVFDAVRETANRTTLGTLRVGEKVNLEPALCVGDPLDGHIVTGHVDAVAVLLSIATVGDGREITFALPRELRALVATKGSIAVDGISLTVAEAGNESFRVAIIPHTFSHTTLANMATGGRVNLEVDVLARYAARQRDIQGGTLSEGLLRQAGF